jgi:hypothetical protein
LLADALRTFIEESEIGESLFWQIKPHQLARAQKYSMQILKKAVLVNDSFAKQ